MLQEFIKTQNATENILMWRIPGICELGQLQQKGGPLRREIKHSLSV
jgi:hypothetical protein